MKTPRLIALLLVHCAVASAFAGTAIVARIKGTAGVVRDGEFEALAVNKSIEDGQFVETKSGSFLRLNLGDGGVLVIYPNTKASIRVKGDATDIILLRGVISGDFKPGTTVRTPGGVVTVGGTLAAVEYADGKLATAALAALQFAGGSPTGGAATGAELTPAGGTAATKIPEGKILLADNDKVRVLTLSSAQAEGIRKGEDALFLIPRPPTPKTVQGTDMSRLRPDLSSIVDVSPGGA